MGIAPRKQSNPGCYLYTEATRFLLRLDVNPPFITSPNLTGQCQDARLNCTVMKRSFPSRERAHDGFDCQKHCVVRLGALAVRSVATALKTKYPELGISIEAIRTTGDKERDIPLPQIGGKGLFTVELERALAEGRVDICVHSMKDVQTVIPDGLGIVSTLRRADARDALVSYGKQTFSQLASGSRVGTGSLRRMAQLRTLRSDLEYVDLRGNLDTRISKALSGELDAVVLAAAGIDAWVGGEDHMRFPIDMMIACSRTRCIASSASRTEDGGDSRGDCDFARSFVKAERP